MKMKMPFSLAFYRETLSRLRVFGVIVTIAFAVLSTFSGARYLFAQVNTFLSGGGINSLTLLTLSDVNGYASILVAVIAPIMTVMAFSFAMKRNESDFYDAIPVTKAEMAFSGMLAVLTSVIFTLVVTSIIPILLLIPCMGVSVKFLLARSLVELLGYIIAVFLAIGAAILAVAVTGTVKSAIITSAVILGGPRLVFGIINSALAMLDHSYVSGHIIPIFNNEWNILTSVLVGDNKAFFNPWSFIYTALLAAVYIGFGVLLFIRRKSEAAGSMFASRVALHAVRIALSAVFSVFGIYVICLTSDLWVLGAVLFVWSAILYFIYGIAWGERKKENFISALKAFPVLCGVVVLVGGFILLSDFVMSSFSPSAEEIDSVSVVSDSGNYTYLSYSEYVTLRSEHIKLDDAPTLKAVASGLDRLNGDEDKEGEYESAVFKIKVGGRIAYRRLHLTVNEMQAIRAELSKGEEYKRLWLSGLDGAVAPLLYVDGVTLSEEAAYRVLEAAKREIASIGFERWFEIYNYGESIANLDYKVYYKNETYEITLPVFAELTETAEIFETERKNQAENTLAAVKNQTELALNSNSQELFIELDCLCKERYVSVYDCIMPDSEKSKGIIEELLPLLSTDAVDYEKPYVILSLYTDDLFSKSYYGYFSIKEGVDEQTVFELFKKYGTEY